eukprot:5753227-Pyramimonas_sp.AAC.1
MFGRFPQDLPESPPDHPWLQQLQVNINALSLLECAYFLDDISPCQLIQAGTLRDDFLKIDVSELRSCFISVSISPTHCDQDILHPTASPCSLPEGEYYCGFMRTGGNLCTLTFHTLAALRLHRA